MPTGPIPLSAHEFPGIDVDDALKRIGCDRVVLASVLRSFTEHHGGMHESIRDAWRAGNIDEARRLAHTIRGSAGNISAVRLHQCALELEHAMSGPEEEVLTALTAFGAALSEAIAGCTAFAATTTALIATGSFDIDVAVPLLCTLDRQLQTRSMSAAQCLSEVCDALTGLQSDELSRLIEQVDALRFREARLTLVRLLGELNRIVRV